MSMKITFQAWARSGQSTASFQDAYEAVADLKSPRMTDVEIERVGTILADWLEMHAMQKARSDLSEIQYLGPKDGKLLRERTSWLEVERIPQEIVFNGWPEIVWRVRIKRYSGTSIARHSPFVPSGTTAMLEDRHLQDAIFCVQNVVTGDDAKRYRQWHEHSYAGLEDLSLTETMVRLVARKAIGVLFCFYDKTSLPTINYSDIEKHWHRAGRPNSEPWEGTR